MRYRLALLAALFAAAFPSTALAEDPAVPADQTAAPADQTAPPPDQTTAPADQTTPPPPSDQTAPPPPAEPAHCLPARAQRSDALSLRGVRVGVRARIRDADGNPLNVASVSYCVTGGGTFSFALSPAADVVLVLSTAPGDAVGRVGPGSTTRAARAAFPKMARLTRRGGTTVYRIDPRRQLVAGMANGRVTFVAAADRLLLEYPSKLAYYLRRLDA